MISADSEVRDACRERMDSPRVGISRGQVVIEIARSDTEFLFSIALLPAMLKQRHGYTIKQVFSGSTIFRFDFKTNKIPPYFFTSPCS